MIATPTPTPGFLVINGAGSLSDRIDFFETEESALAAADQLLRENEINLNKEPVYLFAARRLAQPATA